MSDFHIKKTFNTPEVLLNYSDGKFRMEGRSIPEDPAEFYEEIINNMNDYYNDPKSLTTIELKLEYVNSGSSKWLIDIFRLIKTNYDKGFQCKVLWYYDADDESIQELGQHYKQTFQIPFDLIKY